MGNKTEQAMAVINRMLPPEISKGLATGPTKQFGDGLAELGMVACFEPLWTREGIDLRTRSLVTCAILIALRAHGELAIHFPAAIRNGATLEELEDVIYHAAGYAGFPAAASAREVARESLHKAGMIDA
jgi:4-carboxymuconolactone decarboxylase